MHYILRPLTRKWLLFTALGISEGTLTMENIFLEGPFIYTEFSILMVHDQFS